MRLVSTLCEIHPRACTSCRPDLYKAQENIKSCILWRLHKIAWRKGAISKLALFMWKWGQNVKFPHDHCSILPAKNFYGRKDKCVYLNNNRITLFGNHCSLMAVCGFRVKTFLLTETGPDFTELKHFCLAKISREPVTNYANNMML